MQENCIDFSLESKLALAEVARGISVLMRLNDSSILSIVGYNFAKLSFLVSGRRALPARKVSLLPGCLPSDEVPAAGRGEDVQKFSWWKDKDLQQS